MDLLRAHTYLALLNGQDVGVPPASLLPPGMPAPGGSGAEGVPSASRQQVPPGLRGPGAALLPPMARLINLTVPLTTLLRLNDAPGSAAGYGPLGGDAARLLACGLAGHRATRWQITITSPGGHAPAS